MLTYVTTIDILSSSTNERGDKAMMIKNKHKITFTCRFYDKEYHHKIYSFTTKIRCKTDVLRLCSRFRKFYKLGDGWWFID